MPFVPWKPETEWQRYNFDFEHRLLFRFLDDARRYLSDRGKIFLTFADIGNRAALEGAAVRFGYRITLVSSQTVKGIEHYVFELAQGS